MKNKTSGDSVIQVVAQQGDTLWKKVDDLPKNVKLVSSGRCVAAHGESGHSHVIDHPGAKMYEDENKNIFLDLEGVATLLHEEHGPVTLSAGVWQVGQVREYDYFSKMARKVID